MTRAPGARCARAPGLIPGAISSGALTDACARLLPRGRQVERLVAYKFMATGRIPWVMRHSDPHVISGAVSAKSVRMHTEQRKLVDPATCSLSNPATDRAAVEQLRWCALRAKAWTGGDPRDLDFGVTAVDATVVTLL